MTTTTGEGKKEVPVKQGAIVVSVIAVGLLAIQFVLKPFLNKNKGSSGDDKSAPDAAPAANKSPAAAASTGAAQSVNKPAAGGESSV